MASQQPIDEDAPDLGIESAEVVTKYIEAGKVTQQAMAKVVAACVAGASVATICKIGDDTINELVGTMYNKKVKGQAIPKGVCFPTCLSVNQVICHYSPLLSDPAVVLKAGDIVKIDLGAHLDGFPTFLAKTIAVGASAEAPVTGRAADAVLAAHIASEVALRLIKPGGKSSDVTAAIAKVAAAFSTTPVQGMLSYEISRFRVDGEKSIIQNPVPGQAHEECTFEVNEAYALDILISTGDGKSKEADLRPAVHQRTDEQYSVKLKTTKEFLVETKKFLLFPFSLRSCEHEIKAKMASTECIAHRVLTPYPVLTERAGQFVAQFKTLVLLTEGNVVRVTDPTFDATLFKSEHSLQDAELLKLLETSLGKKKKAKAAAAAAAPAAGADAAKSS